MNEIRALVSKELEKIDYNIKTSFEINNIILKDLNKFISEKSKRIRSILALLYLKANKKTINDDIIKLLTAAELFHNASLLHDDVVDDAKFRRNKETINQVYNSKIAVLSGDFLISKSVTILDEIKTSGITEIFLNTAEIMSKTEMQQFLNRGKKITTEEYINTIKGKTASLFIAIFKSLALLSDIDKIQSELFAEKFGILFQINNDLKTESKNNDKINGVCTIEEILGIEKTESLKDNYKVELREILSKIPNSAFKIGLEELIKKL